MSAVLESERFLHPPLHRAQLGQYLTPPSIATFMASLFELPDAPPGEVRLLDPGAGAGALTAAFAQRWAGRTAPLHVTAVEVDMHVRPALVSTIAQLESHGAHGTVVAGDFVEWAVQQLSLGRRNRPYYDYCIVNPPYRKVNADAHERRLLGEVGVEVTNIYAAFLALAVRLLRANGQLVAITPRSFANGPYFRSFRRDFLSQMAFRTIHVYETRNTAFADDGVLQENVIFHAVKTGRKKTVRITTSHGPHDDDPTVWSVPHDAVVDPDDPELFVHLADDNMAAKVAQRMNRLPCSLKDLGLAVSTGRVVDFRTRENLRMQPGSDTAPLLYPNHFDRGRIRWPAPQGRKPNALAVNGGTARLLLNNGIYVLVKRFSSKEEARRVVAAVTDVRRLPGPVVAFENHLNVFHIEDGPIERDLALGLAGFLNSTVVDLHFRQWSGHTQVNATDLRALRYPAPHQLAALGAAIGDASLRQHEIDKLVARHIPELVDKEGADPVMAHRHITEAQDVLRQLGLPSAQTNERSALTLLALLDLTPDKRWTDVEAPLRGITPMMDFMAEHYGKRYAPNTRETVRRQTVHQFVAAGIAIQNPDNPGRPTNSGKNVYQVPTELVDLVGTYGTGKWSRALASWHKRVPALRERWAKAREEKMVPVTLPDGDELVLSPGGQNPLIKTIVDDFCPRFAPGGHVLYIGDAGSKWAVLRQERLDALGVRVDRHGKMPDLVVHDRVRSRLLVVEAVTSHGPIDAKRHEELGDLFDGCSIDLAYVTAFADRRTFAKHLGAISWDTKVWLAEAPTRLIHFDGVRYVKADD